MADALLQGSSVSINQVLAELPIIVVLMYQLYKQNVHNEVSEFIPLIMNTIGLQPSHQQRSSPVTHLCSYSIGSVVGGTDWVGPLRWGTPLQISISNAGV